MSEHENEPGILAEQPATVDPGDSPDTRPAEVVAEVQEPHVAIGGVAYPPASARELTPEEIEAQMAQQLADEEGPTNFPELEHQPKEEVFGGDPGVNEAIDETVPVLDEVSDEDWKKLETLGELILPNSDSKELDRIYEHITMTILRHQPGRQRLVELKQADHLHAMQIDPKLVLYVTEKERAAMANLAIARRMIRAGHGHDLFADGNWTNLPKVGDTILALGKTNFEKSKDPILQFRGAMGLSGEYPIPLWASGLHLKVTSPGAVESLKLEVKIILEKIDTGRETLGYSLGSSSIYMNVPVIDFVLKHVLSSTAGTVTPSELEQLILLTDLEMLVGASAASAYPDGFPMERPCLKSNGGCGTVTRRKINLRRALFVDFSRLTEVQKDFMVKRSGRHDVLTIRNYQSMTRPSVPRLIDIGKGYFLRLTVPTIAQYKRIAGAWMSRLTNGAKELVTSNANRAEREQFMETQANIALIMAFAHWVEAIVYKPSIEDEEKIIVSRITADPDKQYEADMAVDKELVDFSADGGQTQRVVDEIRKFIDAMTIASYAVPKTKCSNPECGKSVTGDEQGKHPELVQMNTVELFFTLLRHKIQNSGR